MTTRPWMPFYFSDYLADTAHLSTVEHGAYLLLIAHYWAHGKLPDDEATIARITRMTARQWSSSRDRLRSLFGDNWRHKRIDKELGKAIEKSRVNSANAKRRHSERCPSAERSDTQLQPQSQIQKEEEHKAPSLRSGSFTLIGDKLPLEEPVVGPPARAVSRETNFADWPADAFERFYKRYPHKVGRQAALKAFAAAKRSGVPFAHLMFGLDRYINEKPPDVRWCNPATWLNGARWDDEPAKNNGAIDGQRGSRPLQDDSLSLTKAADRLIERAERGEFSFGPRPSLLPKSGEDDLRLLPKG